MMTRCAVLCGSAPKNYFQKKLVDMHDFLTSDGGDPIPERNVIVFPNGVHELLLESVLNGVFDSAAEEDDGEVLLYFCARTESDLSAELSDSVCAGIEVIRLGDNEIRKEVIVYYTETLADMLEVKCSVTYEADDEFVSEETLGYERISIKEPTS